jgi:hypothetical protein
VPIDAAQFSTDSSGNFSYSLRKIKDVYTYNFSLVGDTDYEFMSKSIDLMVLERNAQLLSFSLKKLVAVTIKIFRKSTAPACDTLYLSWVSNGVEGKILYPYTIDNYGKTGNSVGLSSDSGLRWIGGNVNSTVKTRVYADRRTKLYWDLVRNNRRHFFTDTITCRRDMVNYVNFVY